MRQENNPETQLLTKVPLPRFVGYLFWLGTVGFGGPIALAGHMQQDLVDKRTGRIASTSLLSVSLRLRACKYLLVTLRFE